MLVYWGMFLLPALAALLEESIPTRRSGVYLLTILVPIWSIMAFRESGGDYPAYLKMFEMADGRDLTDTLSMGDPGYMALNWLSSTLGLGLYGVNAVCAVVFLYGLYTFVRYEPRPLLMLAIAIPYLIIVVAMGYTRQGTAIGLLLISISHIRVHHTVRAGLSMLAAAFFHSTAAIAFPLLYFSVVAHSKATQRILQATLVVTTIYACYVIFSAKADDFYANYVVSNRYNSDGALIRSLSSAAAGILFIRYRKAWGHYFMDEKIWMVFSILAIASVPASIVASTAIDRMGLYLIPLQLVTFGRLPFILQSTTRFTVVSVVGVYALSLFVWLHLGNFGKQLWLPYKSLIFGTIS